MYILIFIAKILMQLTEMEWMGKIFSITANERLLKINSNVLLSLLFTSKYSVEFLKFFGTFLP